MKKIVFSLLAFSAFAVVAQDFKFHNKRNSPFMNDVINSVMQDGAGTYWVLNDKKLFKYSGYNFEEVSPGGRCTFKYEF